MFNVGLTPTGAFTDRDLKRELSLMLPSAVKRAERGAITRTIRAGRVRISKIVREDIALKSKTVKDALTIKQPKRSETDPVGEITVEPKPIALKEFSARTTRKGVTAKIKKSKGRQVIKGAFIVGSMGGHVFQRVGKSRGPIEKMWGPSVRGNVEAKRDEIDKFLKETFEKNLKDRIKWEIEKERRKR